MGSKFEECVQAQHEINNTCEKKMMSSSLYCQVAVQVSSCSAKGTNWSVFDQVSGWVSGWGDKQILLSQHLEHVL